MSNKPFQMVARTVPLYQRSLPVVVRDKTKFPSKLFFIKLENIVLKSFGELNPVEMAVSRFEDRAAAVVLAATGADDGVFEGPEGDGAKILSTEEYSGSDKITLLKNKCLAVMAYNDYFPGEPNLRQKVSDAILKADAGYCGTFGPHGNDTVSVLRDQFKIFEDHEEGNYDMTQMHLLAVAYRYYNELPEARDKLINVLLATGRIRRPNKGDIFTSGGPPDDYSKSGYMDLPLVVIAEIIGIPLSVAKVGSILGVHPKIKSLGETENHILTIHTARYLTNQLLYQQDNEVNHDNRRNGSPDSPTSCTDLMLKLLRNILRGDFSEYNSKNYQIETRSALLNLCSYAYDHEVRLAARMVLDYISARIATSSNDLRRMVPFRRKNEDIKVAQIEGDKGFMNNSLVEWQLGADPMAAHFAIQAANTRIFEKPNLHPLGDGPVRPDEWTIANDGIDLTLEALSDYRIPALIHDLFVNDLHRRFFQRLHRTPQDDEEETRRNCDNFEIYASSPSYLISAGGSPAPYAIDPHIFGIIPPGEDQQLGVALTTTFLPTTRPNQDCGDPTLASDLIQFSSFSDEPGKASNYGVAPDFACGHKVHLPQWCLDGVIEQHGGKFVFVNKGGTENLPGFYLAILRDGDFTVIEAFDTWLHHELSFDDFRAHVWDRNKFLSAKGLQNDIENIYTTENGNIIHFKIWNSEHSFGAEVLNIEYTDNDPNDKIGDASKPTSQFLHGTVLNNIDDGVIEISNRFLGTTIKLDMKDQWHPKRTDENGVVEDGSINNEVWVNFNWNGKNEGDFFHPFNTLSGAILSVLNNGIIKIMPGITSERPFFPKGKQYKIVAPIGGVVIGAT